MKGFRRNNVPAARRLRRQATPTESALWEALRDRQVDGLKFRRQHPVGIFVIDFYCEERRLAIEIDGGVHSVPANAERDRLRQELLSEHGVRFLRVSTDDVESNIDRVVTLIKAAAKQD